MRSFENKKQLEFVITMGTRKFQGENNVVTMKGFRASIDIDKAGADQMGELRAKIYGVSQADMNTITTLQWKPEITIPNTIDVFAVDGLERTYVYGGNIVNAWADYSGMPDVFLHVQAQTAFDAKLRAAPPSSFKGPVDVSSVMRQIATSIGFSFEDNGVKATLTDIYLANTGLEQAKELAQMAGLGFYVDDKTISITQSPNTPRQGLIPLISAQTGMIGYPTFDGVGVSLRTIFNPALRFGGAVKIETDVQRAAGEWTITSIGHQLTSETPGGAWFSTLRCSAYGLAVTRR